MDPKPAGITPVSALWLALNTLQAQTSKTKDIDLWGSVGDLPTCAGSIK